MESNHAIRLRTVKLIGRLIAPLTEEGLIRVDEEREILTNLKYLAKHGSPVPPIAPKLIDQREGAEMLGIGLSAFKMHEKNGVFEKYFKRRMVGGSVRYRNLDVLAYIMADGVSLTEGDSEFLANDPEARKIYLGERFRM